MLKKIIGLLISGWFIYLAILAILEKISAAQFFNSIAITIGYLFLISKALSEIRKLFGKKKIFLICPVRNVSEEENNKIAGYVKKLENSGHKVYWPKRDTDQNDNIGLRICTDNCKEFSSSDEIHVWYNKNSTGSLFDFGGVFALKKNIIIVNPEAIEPTPHKSFENVLLEIHKQNSQ